MNDAEPSISATRLYVWGCAHSGVSNSEMGLYPGSSAVWAVWCCGIGWAFHRIRSGPYSRGEDVVSVANTGVPAAPAVVPFGPNEETALEMEE
jgi:hypothetical protein